MRAATLVICVVASCEHAAPVDQTSVAPVPMPAPVAADARVATVPVVDAPDDAGKIVVITSDECGLAIDQLYFDSNSAVVRPNQQPVLDATADMFRCWYRTKEILKWEVSGHADTREKDALALSQARADAVKAALVARGVVAGSLDPKGYGASQPLDRSPTAFARAKNRRVSFLVLVTGTP